MKVNLPATTLSQSLAVAICVVSISAPVYVYGQGKGLAQQHSKAVLHEDGTRTESVKDNSKREITETTYDARGVAVTKKIFLLNESGEPTQGVIYDGSGNVMAKVQFFFDTLGRAVEERCLNMQGQIFRRVIRQYDPAGNPLQPQAFDYAENSPSMKSAPINFTQITPAPGGASTQQNNSNVIQPGQTPQIMSVSPSNGQVTSQQPAPEEKKKRGLFNFGGKK